MSNNDPLSEVLARSENKYGLIVLYRHKLEAISKMYREAISERDKIRRERDGVFAEAHRRLDEAGVPSAENTVCNEPGCNSQIGHRIRTLVAGRDKLQKFKDWTHARLDQMGVPHHPPGPHGAEGCRIGDRMDWLEETIKETKAGYLKATLSANNTSRWEKAQTWNQGLMVGVWAGALLTIAVAVIVRLSS